MLVAALWAPIDANMVGLAMSTSIVLVQLSEEMKLVSCKKTIALQSCGTQEAIKMRTPSKRCQQSILLLLGTTVQWNTKVHKLRMKSE